LVDVGANGIIIQKCIKKGGWRITIRFLWPEI
jgi:hypothetical protein